MKNSIIMQINYAERPGGGFGRLSIDDVCARAASLGFSGIEFREKIPASLPIPTFREYVQAIADAKKKYGLTDILFGISTRECANPDASVRASCIADTLEKARIMREIGGAEVCNASANWISSPVPGVPGDSYEFHGSIAATERDWALTVDTYGQIARELETIGLRFAFETHMGYIHDLPSTARRLIDAVGSSALGINLDYGNTVYFPNRPSLEEAIDICGDKLFYTHLKNSVAVRGTNKRMPTALSQGEINHCAYLEKLEDIGYAGPIGIEAPRPGDRWFYAKEDMAYMTYLLSLFD